MKLKSIYSLAELPKTSTLVTDSAMMFRAAKELETKTRELHDRTANYISERYGVTVRKDEDGHVTEDIKLNAAKGRVRLGQDTFGLSEELAEEHILMKWKVDEMRARMDLMRVTVLNQLYSELMVMGVSAKDIESTNFQVDMEEKRVIVSSITGNPIAQLLGTIFGGHDG